MGEGTAKIPKGWDPEAHKHWQAKRPQSAFKILFERLGGSGESAELALQLAYYMFLDGAYGPARDRIQGTCGARCTTRSAPALCIRASNAASMWTNRFPRMCWMRSKVPGRSWFRKRANLATGIG